MSEKYTLSGTVYIGRFDNRGKLVKPENCTLEFSPSEGKTEAESFNCLFYNNKKNNKAEDIPYYRERYKPGRFSRHN